SHEKATHTFVSIFFFFQAEDGIRDGHVTGVQTCALPISNAGRSRRAVAAGQPSGCGPVLNGRRSLRRLLAAPFDGRNSRRSKHRSEERRVGKECRSRWLWEH